jgi:hypothetical protein
MFGLFHVQLHHFDFPLYIFPEADNKKTHDKIYAVKEICDDGHRFILQDDVIEIYQIIAQKYEFNVFLRSLFVLYGMKQGKIHFSFRFKDFYEAYYDNELIPVDLYPYTNIAASDLAKVFLSF